MQDRGMHLYDLQERDREPGALGDTVASPTTRRGSANELARPVLGSDGFDARPPAHDTRVGFYGHHAAQQRLQLPVEAADTRFHEDRLRRCASRLPFRKPRATNHSCRALNRASWRGSTLHTIARTVFSAALLTA